MWTKVVHSLSLFLSLVSERIVSVAVHPLSFSFFVPLLTGTHVFLSLSTRNPRSRLRLCSRVCSYRSSSNLRLLSRSRFALPLPLLFSILQSPALLALQTLLADEARFVLNFLNFTFRGPPEIFAPFSPFFFHQSFVFVGLSRTRLSVTDRLIEIDRADRLKTMVNVKIQTTLGRAYTIPRCASHETQTVLLFTFFIFNLCYQLMTVIKSLGYTSRVRLQPPTMNDYLEITGH